MMGEPGPGRSPLRRVIQYGLGRPPYGGPGQVLPWQPVSPRLVGVGDIDLSGQRQDGDTADPDDMPVTRHGPSPPVRTRREGGPRLWTPGSDHPKQGNRTRHSCAGPPSAQAAAATRLDNDS